MMRYQSPVISTIRQEPFQSQSQYNPDCFGSACNQTLGVDVEENGACRAIGDFLLPDRTDPTPPFACVWVVEDSNGVQQTGQDCSYILDSSCPEGQVWFLDCSMPDSLCNVGFQDGFISCDGELSS